ncbi:MAG: cyclase family protein [Planctomycetes bacterium]|nr:cyclase family protein [Planctomycetota bacterium]
MRGAAAVLLAAALAACASPGPGPAPDPPPAAAPSPVPDLLAALRGREMVDLTWPLDDRVPYWPGAKYFPLEAWTLAKWEEVRAFSRAYRIPEHYGTHVDAPIHFAEGRRTIEQVPLEELYGPAVLFDIADRAARDPDAVLEVEDVLAWESVHGRVPRGAVALLRTGWADRWGDPGRYRNFDAEGRLRFPSFGPEAARLLIDDRGAVGLGVDVLSIDRGIDHEFPVHRHGSERNRWFLENAANLHRLPPSGAVVLVLPIPLRGGSGAQARVVAFLPPVK